MGGGLAGLTLALQLKQRFADIDVAGAGAPRAPGAACGAQGRRIVGRDRRPLLRHGARAQAAHAGRPAAQVRLPLLLQRRPARHRPGDRDRRQPLPLGAELPDRPRHLRELPGRGSARAAACASSTARWCASIELADDAGGPHRLDWRAGGEHAPRPRALARRRLRPRRPAQAQARAGPAERARLPTPSGSASASASPSTTGPTTPPGARAASRRRAGSRPTTWSARATGSG